MYINTTSKQPLYHNMYMSTIIHKMACLPSDEVVGQNVSELTGGLLASRLLIPRATPAAMAAPRAVVSTMWLRTLRRNRMGWDEGER